MIEISFIPAQHVQDVCLSVKVVISVRVECVTWSHGQPAQVNRLI